MKLVTVSQMRTIEQQADANGLTYAKMMENAGLGLAQEIEVLSYSADGRNVFALAGAGNNGGDALVALAHLAAEGWQTRAYLVRRKADGDPLVEHLKAAGGEVLDAADDPDFEKLTAFIGTADVVVDGVLGTGLKLPLKPEIARVLDAVNQAIAALSWPPYVVAVDCPSGVDCDTGEAAPETIPASLTVCMAAVKRGLLQLPAFELAGELSVVDIGLSDEEAWQTVRHQVANDELLEELLPVRPLDAHKGTFGTALVVAGSLNYPGAALLAGKAAYRAGAGLVQMAVPGPVQSLMAGSFPEATWALLPHEMGALTAAAAESLSKHFERATALLVGPGLGEADSTAKFIKNLLNSKSSARKSPGIGFVLKDSQADEEKNAPALPPLVVDADGLRLLAKIENWHEHLPKTAVLTPHPGEMAALTGLEKDEIQKDRLGIALKYAAEWGHVVVLKGAFTVIAAPDGCATVVPVAHPSLARAGSGDVLAGLIVGLRAQGLDAYEAAIAGAWIHAQAGLLAADQVGAAGSVLAGDILDAIPDALSGF
jgi:ADP-dependent NAD(P)H-hydrate dehydratase / NAD(P)H-hydrate epimerase